MTVPVATLAPEQALRLLGVRVVRRSGEMWRRCRAIRRSRSIFNEVLRAATGA